MFFQLERLFIIFLVCACSFVALKFGVYDMFKLEGNVGLMNIVGNTIVAPYQFCFIALGPAFLFFLISDKIKYGGWGYEAVGYKGFSFATIGNYVEVYFAPKCFECGASVRPGIDFCSSCGACLREETCS